MNENIKITPVDLERDYSLVKNLFPMIDHSFLLQLDHIKSLKSIKFPTKDASFILEDKKQKILVAALSYEDSMGLGNWPVQVLCDQGRDVDATNASMAIKKLKENSSAFTMNAWFSLEEVPASLESKEQEVLDINLLQSEEEILRGARKSYRSLFNWGKRSLLPTIHDSSNVTEETFTHFSDYYDQVSGKKKSKDFWDGLFLMVKHGHGFITLATMEGKLTSATLILHGSEEGYYALGAYDKDCMEKNIPVSHWPILYSIFHAKRIGLKKIELGFIDSSGSTPKEENIFKFKKGFTDSLSKRPLFSWSYQQADKA